MSIRCVSLIQVTICLQHHQRLLQRLYQNLVKPTQQVTLLNQQQQKVNLNILVQKLNYQLCKTLAISKHVTCTKYIYELYISHLHTRDKVRFWILLSSRLRPMSSFCSLWVNDRLHADIACYFAYMFCKIVTFNGCSN